LIPGFNTLFQTFPATSFTLPQMFHGMI
jgi:hypothetical protein